MTSKAIIGITLTLLLIGMLTLAFNIPISNASLPVHNIDTGEDFVAIQEAMDDPDTLDGHTILVDSGAYYENVVVDKSVSLIGENPINTIVDGSESGDVIRVTTNNVVIENFTVKHGGSGIFLESVNNCTIKNNNITNTARARYGIWLSASSYNTVSENNITPQDNLGTGIYLNSSSNHNSVSRNSISGSDTNGWSIIDHGVRLSSSSNHNSVSENNITTTERLEIHNGILVSSSYNTISGNNITSMGGFYASGIVLSSPRPYNTISGNNTIFENYIETSGFMAWGIDLWFCSNNTLSGNEMRSSGFNLGVEGSTLNHFMHSIDDSNLVWGKPVYYLVNQKDFVMNPETHPQVGYLALINSTNITVEGQTLELNDIGLLLLYTNNSRIANNTIKHNWDGVSLRGSFNNTISGNNIMHNWGAPDAPEGDGIQLGVSWYPAWGSSGNIISGNNIANNGGIGIRLSFSNHTTVSGNNITNNSQEGIYLRYSSNYNSIYGNNITNNEWVGIDLSSSSNYNSIYGNNITNNFWSGIELGSSSNNSIYGNHVANNLFEGGISLYSSSNNSIYGNYVANNEYGIELGEASNNTFYHNNFINNTQQVYDCSWVWPEDYSPSINAWDDGYPSGGNYWSDYDGVDLYRGSHQNEAGSDGIGDTPYIIDGNNKDRYPLIYQYGYVPSPDINDDGKVNIHDIIQAALAFGSYPEHPRWNPFADMNGDRIIDIFDLVLIARNFGKTA